MKPVRSAYHPGEIEVQRRAGVRDEADEVGAIIGGRIPPAFVPLLAGFRLAVAASIDGRGRVWASLLTGPPGFLQATSEMRLRIEARPAPGDPLEVNLAARPELGLLAFDPATRRRMRFNGREVLGRSGGITLDIEQAYGNCRKYIQVRYLEEEEARPQAAMPARPASARSESLSARQHNRIAAADTFFIASAHPEGGADASHRGGRPGFVRLEGDRKLSFPDYAGNNMFNTLGNLTADPRAGLLFVDFESGDLLQLTGRARLVWEPEAVAAHRGAQHVVVELEIDEVLETRAASPLRWRLIEASPFNP
jgi:predicted pyridoxine 5'-phosphate oxidase superfamily flavin-nucleotide-binding protein